MVEDIRDSSQCQLNANSSNSSVEIFKISPLSKDDIHWFRDNLQIEPPVIKSHIQFKMNLAQYPIERTEYPKLTDGLEI